MKSHRYNHMMSRVSGYNDPVAIPGELNSTEVMTGISVLSARSADIFAINCAEEYVDFFSSGDTERDYYFTTSELRKCLEVAKQWAGKRIYKLDVSEDNRELARSAAEAASIMYSISENRPRKNQRSSAPWVISRMVAIACGYLRSEITLLDSPFRNRGFALSCSYDAADLASLGSYYVGDKVYTEDDEHKRQLSILRELIRDDAAESVFLDQSYDIRPLSGNAEQIPFSTLVRRYVRELVSWARNSPLMKWEEAINEIEADLYEQDTADFWFMGQYQGPKGKRFHPQTFTQVAIFSSQADDPKHCFRYYLDKMSQRNQSLSKRVSKNSMSKLKKGSDDISGLVPYHHSVAGIFDLTNKDKMPTKEQLAALYYVEPALLDKFPGGSEYFRMLLLDDPSLANSLIDPDYRTQLDLISNAYEMLTPKQRFRLWLDSFEPRLENFEAAFPQHTYLREFVERSRKSGRVDMKDRLDTFERFEHDTRPYEIAVQDGQRILYDLSNRTVDHASNHSVNYHNAMMSRIHPRDRKQDVLNTVQRVTDDWMRRRLAPQLEARVSDTPKKQLTSKSKKKGDSIGRKYGSKK